MTEAAAYTSSPFVGSIEPITASDDEIRAALEDAEVPPLLPALAVSAATAIASPPLLFLARQQLNQVVQ